MAKYLVTQEPGVQLTPGGFIRSGETLELPDDETPSRALTPLDDAAVKALEKAKADYVADLERRMGELEPPRKLPAATRRELLRIPPMPGDAPKKPKDEGITARQLSEQLGHGGAKALGADEKPAADAKKGGGTRAADR
jgi:hypothetical protein